VSILIFCSKLGTSQKTLVNGGTTENPKPHVSTTTPSCAPTIPDGSIVKPEEPPTDALKVLGVLKCGKITDRVINAARGIFQYHVTRKFKNPF